MADHSVNEHAVDLFVDIVVVAQFVHILVVDDISEIVGVGFNEEFPIFFCLVIFVVLISIFKSRLIERRCGEDVVARHFFERRRGDIVEAVHGRNAGFAEFAVEVVSFKGRISFRRVVTHARTRLEIVERSALDVGVGHSVANVHMSRKDVARAHIEQAFCGVFPIVDGEVFEDFVFHFPMRKRVLVEASDDGGFTEIRGSVSCVAEFFHPIEQAFGESASAEVVKPRGAEHDSVFVAVERRLRIDGFGGIDCAFFGCAVVGVVFAVLLFIALYYLVFVTAYANVCTGFVRFYGFSVVSVNGHDSVIRQAFDVDFCGKRKSVFVVADLIILVEFRG